MTTEQAPDPRPWLFLDIDGVLNPCDARRTRPGFLDLRLAGFPVRLDPRHGAVLQGFADRFELAWATSWEDLANELVAPVLGLPPLPVVHFDLVATRDHKWPAIDAFAADRPLAWIDDEPRVGDIAWAQRRDHRVPTRIVKTDARAGVLREHLAILERFAARVTARGG